MEGIMGHFEHMQRYGSVDSSGQQCMKTQENLFRDVAHVKRHGNINSGDAMPPISNL